MNPPTENPPSIKELSESSPYKSLCRSSYVDRAMGSSSCSLQGSSQPSPVIWPSLLLNGSVDLVLLQPTFPQNSVSIPFLLQSTTGQVLFLASLSPCSSASEMVTPWSSLNLNHYRNRDSRAERTQGFDLSNL